MRNVNLYSYNKFSESGKLLSQALGIRRIKHERSRYRGRPTKAVINWGSSNLPQEVMNSVVINPPDRVAVAANKLWAFQDMVGEVCIPKFTNIKEQAQDWLDEGLTVLERHTLTGHSGRGIRVVEAGEELEDAPLYVEYVPKRHEYRVHVFPELHSAHIQRKARRVDVPDDQVDWKIRNHGNGFIFAANDALGEVSPKVVEEAVKAVETLGLNFGAVDVVFNERRDEAYVLEVNTACGLAGATVDFYAESLRELINGW